MPCQPGRTRHTMRPNWEQNDKDLRAGMKPCSGRAKVVLRQRSAWRTRNWAK